MVALWIVSAVTALEIAISRSSSAATPTDLAITARATSLRSGASAVYLVTVSNVGNATTNDAIVVTDQLPEGLIFGFSGAGGWDCTATGQLLTCTNTGPLPPRSRSILRLLVRVRNAGRGTIVNNFTVDYAGDTNVFNNTITQTSVVRAGVRGPRPRHAPIVVPVNNPQANAAATDLILSKTIGSETFRVGANATYKLTVRNAGPAVTDAPMTVTDSLPDGLGFVSVSGAGWVCGVSQETITCVSQDPLAVGADTTIALRVRVGDAAYPTVTNSATLAYAGDTDTANNLARRPTTIRLPLASVTPTRAATRAVRTSTPTATFTPASAVAVTDLLLKTTIDGTFRVGSTAGYSIMVSNLGPNASNAGITVTDDLPAGLSFASVRDPNWLCSSFEQTVSCTTNNQLAVGAQLGLKLTVNVGSEAFPTVTNVVKLAYPGDSNLGNNTSHVPTTVRQ